MRQSAPLFIYQHMSSKPRTTSIKADAATNLLLEMNRSRLRVPLSWVATTEQQPATNFGDGLSALVVSALAGLPVERANFDQACERLVAVGTIGHNQKNGVLHFWGTGIDATRNPLGVEGPYQRPPDTEFHIHALRGPASAETFQAVGIDAPAIYGDPVWLLPRIWPLADVEKTHELGIVLHISELNEQNPEAVVRDIYARYRIPEDMQGSIRLINTFAPATVDGMRDKVAEILSCRRILSTSLHGLVIAETYGVPCAWFATYGDGNPVDLDLKDPDTKIDHRIRDFYRGLGRNAIKTFAQDRKLVTDWAKAIAFVDGYWKRETRYNPVPLIRAFPLPRRTDAEAGIWNVDATIFDHVPF